MANQATWTQGEGETKKSISFHIGDTVRVYYKLIEKEKVSGKTKREVKEQTRERLQVFEGIVIAIKGSGSNLMFTVRRIGAAAIGIERIFPIVSPWIRKIDIKKHGKVKRAKLYYMRGKLGKEASRVAEFVPKS
jgi:large subunit ribosomal protein L19